jgi:hypothetical protein
MSVDPQDKLELTEEPAAPAGVIRDPPEADDRKLSLAEIIDALPIGDRTRLSEQYAKWYNLLIRLYKKDFGLDDADDCKREFRSEDQVIMFFREALLWWYRRKPKVNESMTPLEALKTRTCLGQIASLKRRLEETGIPLRKLKLNEHFDRETTIPPAAQKAQGPETK